MISQDTEGEDSGFVWQIMSVLARGGEIKHSTVKQAVRSRSTSEDFPLQTVVISVGESETRIVPADFSVVVLFFCQQSHLTNVKGV